MDQSQDVRSSINVFDHFMPFNGYFVVVGFILFGIQNCLSKLIKTSKSAQLTYNFFIFLILILQCFNIVILYVGISGTTFFFIEQPAYISINRLKSMANLPKIVFIPIFVCNLKFWLRVRVWERLIFVRLFFQRQVTTVLLRQTKIFSLEAVF